MKSAAKVRESAQDGLGFLLALPIYGIRVVAATTSYLADYLADRISESFTLATKPLEYFQPKDVQLYGEESLFMERVLNRDALSQLLGDLGTSSEHLPLTYQKQILRSSIADFQKFPEQRTLVQYGLSDSLLCNIVNSLRQADMAESDSRKAIVSYHLSFLRRCYQKDHSVRGCEEKFGATVRAVEKWVSCLKEKDEDLFVLKEESRRDNVWNFPSTPFSFDR